jgi:hypothetical protein
MEKTAIRDSSGQIIGYLDDDGDNQVVRNRHGEIVGRVVGGHTYDKNWNMVSREENPGLLYGGLNE